MIVLSPDLALASPAPGDDNPIILWRNRMDDGNVSASGSDPLYPISNIYTPSTWERWQGVGTAGATITFSAGDADDIDCVALARHNLHSAGYKAKVQGDQGAGFADLVEYQFPGSDGPLMFRFARQAWVALRLVIAPLAGAGAAAPRIGVMSIGALLILPRRIWQDFVPLPYARVVKRINGESEGGHFLGSIATSEYVQGRIPLSLIEPAWYRENMDEFVAAAVLGVPFFFAWRPQTYPDETAYLWARNDAQPRNETGHGLTAIDLEVTGVV